MRIKALDTLNRKLENTNSDIQSWTVQKMIAKDEGNYSAFIRIITFLFIIGIIILMVIWIT